MGICEGRVCVVTGAGRGIGREYALLLAREGARVVVNDLGGDMDGSGTPTTGPALEVVDEIRDLGGEAVANGDDVSSFDGAARLIATAVETFGDLHVLVNNAGILRDRMLVNMTEQEWDSVIQVHLKGTFAPAHHAANHWREQAKAADAGAGDRPVGRIINTTSVSGIYGNPGQTNYGAAKAGIASFTFIASMELARYGVTVNAVAPAALTRMTEGLGAGPPTDEAQGGHEPAVDRPDRRVAGIRGVVAGHRPGVRGLGTVARRRRGVAPRSDRPAGRGSGGSGTTGRGAPGPRPAARRHERRRPGALRSLLRGPPTLPDGPWRHTAGTDAQDPP